MREPHKGDRQFLGHRLGKRGVPGDRAQKPGPCQGPPAWGDRPEPGNIPGTDGRGGEPFYHRLSGLLPERAVPEHAAGPGRLAPPETPLRADQAVQKPVHSCCLPPPAGGAGAAGASIGVIGKRVVASVEQRTGETGHAYRMVRQPGTGQSGRPSCRGEQCRKPPRYVTRTPGGVRGGTARCLLTRFLREFRKPICICRRPSA